ncbi:MAG: HisA/HisF-related TIM barrel protein [Gemmataceae bacterium]|nr:HisA/HisF-related TIM barrel protein [Gemmataceae bacterium]MCI0740284.1 HisA/HisF-related TIM barrel protein [Gemmataceae bacterium]
MIQIVPVLDLLGGQVVRGMAGRRQEYRPIVSRLCTSSEPLPIARAFRAQFGLDTLYLADLDSILFQPSEPRPSGSGKAPALSLYRELQDDGFTLCVDAGVRDAASARPIAEAGVDTIVAGLETLDGPATLRELVQYYGAERIVFSLDLKEGKPLAAPNWGSDPQRIAETALGCGANRFIVLDLARVGVGCGTGTEAICAWLSKRWPDLRVTAGGGLRSIDDIQRLAQCGVSTALVASALHDGRITPADLSDL